jgi:RNA recognition motif-containing protein
MIVLPQSPGTKLMIKNVPFEAPAKELRELFGTYGQVCIIIHSFICALLSTYCCAFVNQSNRLNDCVYQRNSMALIVVLHSLIS